MYPITDAVKALFEAEYKKVLRITYTDTSTKSETGSMVSVNDAAGADAASLSVAINSVQSGSGDPSPENVRPIQGWTGATVHRAGKNIGKISDDALGSHQRGAMQYSDDGVTVTSTGNYCRVGYLFSVKAGQKYCVSYKARGVGFKRICYGELDGAWGTVDQGFWGHRTIGEEEAGYRYAFTAADSGLFFFGIYVSTTNYDGNYIQVSDFQLEPGSVATDYEPCRGAAYDIPFPAEAGTVCAGTLDVTTGLLTVRRAMVDDFSGLRANGQSTTGAYRYRLDVENSAVYSVSRQCASNVLTYSVVYNAAANTFYNGGDYFYITLDAPTVAEAVAWLEDNSVVIVYPLTTPTIYQLDPVAVALLQGTNNLWADAGAVTVEYHPAATITEADILMDGFNIDRYCCNGEKLEVGTAIAGQMTLKLNNTDGKFDDQVFESNEIFAEIGIADWTQSDPTINYIPCGYFTPDMQPRRLNHIELTCLDRMTKFDVVVDPDDITLPTTVAGLVGQMNALCGVKLAQSIDTLPNADVVITELPTVTGEMTYRNVLQWCAGIMATNAWFDWDGLLRFTWYGAETGYVTITGNRFDSDYYEDDLTITGAICTNSSGVEIVEGTDDYAIDLSGNALAELLIATVLPVVNTTVNGLTYRPLTAAVVSAPYLWPMDAITFADKDGNTYSSVLTNVAFGLNGTTALESKGMTYAINQRAQPKGITKEQAQLLNEVAKIVADNIDASLTQQDIFNRLTNNGAAQGLFMTQDGQLFVNASYLGAGEINAAIVRIINLSANDISSGLIHSADYSITDVPFIYPADSLYPSDDLYPNNGERVVSGFAIDFKTGQIYGGFYSARITELQETVGELQETVAELRDAITAMQAALVYPKDRPTLTAPMALAPMGAAELNEVNEAETEEDE